MPSRTIGQFKLRQEPPGRHDDDLAENALKLAPASAIDDAARPQERRLPHLFQLFQSRVTLAKKETDGCCKSREPPPRRRIAPACIFHILLIFRLHNNKLNI